MKKMVLAIALIATATFPALAVDMIGIGGSIGVGANKDFMDAGYTAVDLSLSISMSLLPIRFDDFAAGITVRATGGATVISDTTSIEWYALTPMFTIMFLDDAPMFISAGYGPYAYSVLPDRYIYSPAVVLGFMTGAGTMEIGMIGPSVFLGFGLTI